VGELPRSDPPNGRQAELEHRLCEELADNAQLSAELRYLRRNLNLQNEYIAELESDLATAQVIVAEQAVLVAEYSAYRSRIALRVVDGVIVRLQRHRLLYTTLRRLGRLATGLSSATGRHGGAGRPQ
jgi:hypothetical protein